MKARDLISKEKDDMVAAVQASLLFQSLGTTREEILAKYPLNTHSKTETMEEEGDCSDDEQVAMDIHNFHGVQHPPYLMMPPEGQPQISGSQFLNGDCG